MFLSCLLAVSTQEGTALLLFCFCLFGNNIIRNIPDGVLWRLFKKNYSNRYLLKLFIFSWMLKLISRPGNWWIAHAVCMCMGLKAFQQLIDTQFTYHMLEIDESKCGASISESPACKRMGVILHQILNLTAAFTDFIAFALSVYFILHSEGCYNRKLKCRYWTEEKKAVTFTSCSLCSYVLGRGKKGRQWNKRA